LLRAIPNELVPAEDRGTFFVSIRGPEGAGFQYMRHYTGQIEDKTMYLVEETKEARVILIRTGSDNGGFAFISLVPWEQRERSGQEIVRELREKYADITGVRVFVNMRQGISAGRGSPVQFVVGGDTYEQLAAFREVLEAEARKLPLTGIDTDYRETQPQMRIRVNRDRAADPGVSVQVIGQTLETMMGGRRVTTFTDRGEEYDVILQAADADRQSPSDLANIYVRSARSNQLIPLSNLVTVKERAASPELNRFNRVRAITLSAQLEEGYTLGQALTDLEQMVREKLPEATSIDYKGESRELQKAGGAVIFTFAMAFAVVFLILAAQFESFLHPFVIMLTVPLAAAGGLLGLLVAGSTLNIYSQIGLVMLIGLAAKNGVLIVEFANQRRDQGRSVREAIEEASQIRLRPIIMTSLSTVMGAVPLILTFGPGSASRVTIGVVIFAGVSISAVLTLFLVPVFYDMLAGFTRSPGYEAARLKRQEEDRARAAAGPASAPAE